jgi:hypothetical protein
VSVDHACQTGCHRLAERANDLYETPAVAVEALLRTEHLPHRIWEPACGPGAIVRVLRDAGHDVLATDLIDYGLDDSEAGIDFLMEWRLPDGIEAIVTNPPFKTADQFVRHALVLCPRVYMLLRLAFLESERRTAILESGFLRLVYVFRKRLPMMHRSGWEGPRASSALAFAWFCWDRTNPGPTELRRVKS